MLIPVVEQSVSVVHAYIYSSKNIIFQEMFYGHLLLLTGMHNLQWILVGNTTHLWKSQHLQEKKKTTDTLLCISHVA